MSMFKKAIIAACIFIALLIIVIIHQIRRDTTDLMGSQAITDTTTSSKLYTYDNHDSRYSIKYPKDWVYDQSNPGTVIFSGKQGTPEFFSTVNIQTILTKKSGGDYEDVKAFTDDINKQAKKESSEAKFLEQGPISITAVNGLKMEGQYLIFTYKYRNIMFKQWQIVLLRNDGQVFYAWAYTSPVAQYDKDLPIAQEMLKTWVIY